MEPTQPIHQSISNGLHNATSSRRSSSIKGFSQPHKFPIFNKFPNYLISRCRHFGADGKSKLANTHLLHKRSNRRSQIDNRIWIIEKQRQERIRSLCSGNDLYYRIISNKIRFKVHYFFVVIIFNDEKSLCIHAQTLEPIRSRISKNVPFEPAKYRTRIVHCLSEIN